MGVGKICCQPAGQPPSALARSQTKQQFHNKFLCDILISTSDLHFAFILCVWHKSESLFFLWEKECGGRVTRKFTNGNSDKKGDVRVRA